MSITAYGDTSAALQPSNNIPPMCNWDIHGAKD
jgi:hypothetical protein